MPRPFVVAALIAAAAAPAFAQTQLSAQRIVSGLARPVALVHAPGDFDRVFIAEQRGSGGVANRGDVRIMNLADSSVNATPFLSIGGLYTTGNETGLLGIAFHPDYAANGYFYVNYTTESEGRGVRTVVQRFTVSANPNVADPASGQVVLEIPNPTHIHHGGTLVFGPDGYLYITRGDGGSHNDPSNNAQNRNVLLGKILRIDVNGDDFPADPLRNYAIPPTNPFADGVNGRPEIWAYGVRNPWKGSFDPATGDFWFADVGQNAWEEINFQPAASAGGENYGWRCFEGLVPHITTGCPDQSTMTPPIHTYQHVDGLCSITGGHVYRGCEVPDLDGTYFFADWCTGRIWSLKYDGIAVTDLTERTEELDPNAGEVTGLSNIGVDAYGELYFLDGSPFGEVFRIRPVSLAAPDCNGNGRADACEIRDGSAKDANNNGIPDECDPAACPADFNNDGELTSADFSSFRAAYLASDPRCDLNHSGGLDPGDFTAFRTAYLAGCP